MGRRMAEMQVHLSEQVLPEVPIRQWVLTVPKPIRYVLAYNREACSAVLNIFLGCVSRWLKRQAKKQFGLASVADAHPGAVTAVQRHGSAADLNVHFHSLVTDGVFIEAAGGGRPVFKALQAPSPEDVASLSWEMCQRSIDWLRQHNLWLDADPVDDQLAQEQPLLAACATASLQGRVLFGNRAGSGILRLQNPLLAERLPQSQPAGSGFHLHAAVRAAANDTQAKATLCRYIVRPPIANDRLTVLADGRVQLRLKRAWSNGTTHMVFEPLDFIARLVALIPPPKAHQVRFHGVFAPHHRLRKSIVPRTAAPIPLAHNQDEVSGQSVAHRHRQSWAVLLKKTFAIDVSTCAHCGGQTRVMAAVTEPAAIVRILKHLGLPTDPPRFHPARAPPDATQLELDAFTDAA